MPAETQRGWWEGPILMLAGIEWDAVWQRQHVFAAHFAKRAPVVFVEHTGSRAPRISDAGRVLRRLRAALSRRAAPINPQPVNVAVVSPVLLPPVRGARGINAALGSRLARRLRERYAAGGTVSVYVNVPSRTNLDLIGALEPGVLVFDCVENYTAVPGAPRETAAMEQALAVGADLTIATSRYLCQRLQPLARRLLWLPPGVDLAAFPEAPPTSPLRGAPPRVLYFGTLYDLHMDVELICFLAESRPNWQFTLLGPLKSQHRFPANVQLRGQVPHRKLAEHVREHDMLFLPYRINSYTDGVFPAKIFECLATGKPVVCTAIPEMRRELAELLYLARGREEFLAQLERAVREDGEERRRARIAAARANTWEHRLVVLDRALAGLGNGALAVSAPPVSKRLWT